MLAQLLVKLVTKLATEALIGKVTVYLLWEIAKSTGGTKLDDNIVKAVSEALGVTLPE